MARLRIHFPPDERPRRLLILLPLLVGLGAVALGFLFPRRLGLEAHVPSKVLPLIACATVSFSPMLGLLLWHVSPWRRFRSRWATLTEEGFRVVTLLRGARSFRWADFQSILVLPAAAERYALCTPRGGGGTWILEISAELFEALPAALAERMGSLVVSRGGPGHATGELAFLYQRRVDPLNRGWIDFWVFSGVALWLVFLYSRFGLGSESYYGCLLLPAYPIHAIASLGFLTTFLAYHRTCALLRISGQECSFRVPHRNTLLQYPGSPSMIRGRAEIGDPSGTSSRLYVLPAGSLPPRTQLSIIEALLPPESGAERATREKEEDPQ